MRHLEVLKPNLVAFGHFSPIKKCGKFIKEGMFILRFNHGFEMVNVWCGPR